MVANKSKSAVQIQAKTQLTKLNMCQPMRKFAVILNCITRTMDVQWQEEKEESLKGTNEIPYFVISV